MRIGFFVQGSGTHWDIAKHLIASVKRHMPGTGVFQLTDTETPAHEGVSVIRLAGDMPMAVRRMRLHSMLAGDWLFVDSDVVIRKDVSHVFQSPFDIGLTDRVGSAWENSPDVKTMPYNMGVTFSRSPEFWRRAGEIVQTLPDALQQWAGDQLVVCQLQRAGWIKTKILPGLIYNHTPVNQHDDYGDAAILHLKGPRKSWLQDPIYVAKLSGG